jgi:hypothetical protein
MFDHFTTDIIGSRFNLVMRGKIGEFYRGAVECAFNRPKAA